METKDIIDIADSKLATNLYKDVASPAMKQIGQGAEGLMKFVALPFKFLGLTAEQLEKKYHKFIETAINRVPPQKLAYPQSSVASPLLDYVKFCFDDEPGNDLLQEMFSKLLSSSMNQDKAYSLNKAFVETMRFLSGNEAKILNWCSDVVKMRNNFLTASCNYDLDDIALGLHPCMLSLTIYNDEKKNIEISVGAPGKFAYENFPTNESLDLLESLGLITVKREYDYSLLKDLLTYNNHPRSFELPPIFSKALLELQKHLMVPKSSCYRSLYKTIILKSEVEQIDKLLSFQDPESTAKQLLSMGEHLVNIHITSYGLRFLHCCT